MRCRLHIHHCLQQFLNHLGCLLFTKLLDLVQRLLYLPGGLFFDLRMGAGVLYCIGENTISIHPYMLPSTNEPPSWLWSNGSATIPETQSAGTPPPSGAYILRSPSVPRNVRPSLSGCGLAVHQLAGLLIAGAPVGSGRGDVIGRGRRVVGEGWHTGARLLDDLLSFAFGLQKWVLSL